MYNRDGAYSAIREGHIQACGVSELCYLYCCDFFFQLGEHIYYEEQRFKYGYTETNIFCLLLALCTKKWAWPILALILLGHVRQIVIKKEGV